MNMKIIPRKNRRYYLDRIVRASSNPGDIVLDLFSGTFTTAATAKILNRKSISIESQDEYLKIGLRRVLEFDEYQGKSLEKPKKSTQIKNIRKIKEEPSTGDLFNVSPNPRFHE
jgi:adenine-specific DNA-methyltransferase